MRSVLTWPRGIDRAGVLASAACAVHCVATPIMAGVLPVWIADERTEVVFLMTSAVIALVSMWMGCRRHHGRIWPLVLVACGFAAILGVRQIASEGSAVEIAAVATCLTLVCLAHVANWTMCCKQPHDDGS